MGGPCVFITNPLSGGYSTGRVEEALSSLKRSGFDPATVEVITPDAAALCAARICDEFPDPLIIVAGGDGTINGVVNGLVPGAATLAVLPFGTSNVLSRELGIVSMSHALEKIAAGGARQASVGYLEKGETGRCFLLMAGIGLDGSIVKGVRTSEKRFLKKGAYLLSALRLLFSWESGRLNVISGGNVTACHTVIACNASKYAGDLVLAPHASLFSPELSVVCFVNGARTAYLKTALSLLLGKDLDGRGIAAFSAREIEVSGTKPIQADGDYYFDAPVRIRSIPDYFRIIV